MDLELGTCWMMAYVNQLDREYGVLSDPLSRHLSTD